MNVVYAVTRDYYEKIRPSVYSLFEHNTDVDLYVIAEDDDLNIRLPKEPHVINVSDQTWFGTGSVNYNNRFTYINLVKVCYASLIPVGKVLHLDADTVICDELSQFYNVDLSDKWLGVIEETEGSYRPFGLHYYNMGVALINLAQMRADNIEQTLVDYLNSSSQPWADQDAWNKYGLEQNKIVSVDRRYNENFATGYTNEPAIVHYCGVPDWWINRRMKRCEYLDHARDLSGPPVRKN